jgi:predicted nucleotidyltransferase
MTEYIPRLLSELKAGLQGLYGTRLVGAYLFGSYARGDQDRESDLDVLIVLDHYERYGEEIERTGALASELSLKYNISISKVFMSEHEYLYGDTPLLRNLRSDAVAV